MKDVKAVHKRLYKIIKDCCKGACSVNLRRSTEAGTLYRFNGTVEGDRKNFLDGIGKIFRIKQVVNIGSGVEFLITDEIKTFTNTSDNKAEVNK